MTNRRCGNCRHLDRASETNLGGLRIAKCTHPAGVTIQGTPIKDDFVELDARCSEHVARVGTANARR
ncbi:MAG: hypothetical protein HY847_04810 [Betaproteobacteria bacterium]|nr:hypothetical protein [Betaproteobacteria bacterium]